MNTWMPEPGMGALSTALPLSHLTIATCWC